VIPWAVAGKRDIPCCPESHLKEGHDGILDSQTSIQKKKLVVAAKWDWTVVATGLTNFVTMTSKNFALTKE
jgi:hypothetical protein